MEQVGREDFQRMTEALLKAGLKPELIHFSQTRIEKRAKDDRGRSMDGEEVKTTFDISPPKVVHVLTEKFKVAPGHVPEAQVEKWKGWYKVAQAEVEKWKGKYNVARAAILIAFLFGAILGAALGGAEQRGKILQAQGAKR